MAPSAASRLSRVELVLASAGLGFALLALIVGADVIRFHLGSTVDAVAEGRWGSLHLSSVALLAIALADAVALAVAARSALRQVHAQSAFLRSLPLRETCRLDGVVVSIVDDALPRAFCAGLLRPRVFVSTGALALLSDEERAAVLAHEAHHATRRDPLRLLISRAVSDVFVLVPPLAALGRRQAELAELAADAAAIRRSGSSRPLAAALLAFEGNGPPAVVGISPERVDHLLGHPQGVDVRAPALVASALALSSVLALTVQAALAPGHVEVEVARSAIPLCAIALCALLAAATGPAWATARRLLVRASQ